VHGYKLGDIRGGISASVPLLPLIAIERSSFLTFAIIDGLLWLIGIVGIGCGMYFLSRQISHRFRVEEKLRQREKFEGVIEMAGAVCHELNQPMQAISGYSELLMMDIENDNPFQNKIVAIRQQIDRMGLMTKKLMGITKYETTDYLKSKIIDINKSSK
jgi:signal transduction histidine kinase